MVVPEEDKSYQLPSTSVARNEQQQERGSERLGACQLPSSVFFPHLEFLLASLIPSASTEHEFISMPVPIVRVSEAEAGSAPDSGPTPKAPEAHVTGTYTHHLPLCFMRQLKQRSSYRDSQPSSHNTKLENVYFR